MMKRLFTLVLVLLMIFTLVGCGKSNKREIVKLTLSTEDAEAILAAAGITLPDAEDTAAAGTVVKYYSWYDPFNNYSEDEIVNTGYFTFTEKYGSSIEWIECEWGARFDSLANLILSGDAPDIFPGEANTFPNQSLKGVFQSVDDYIDYDDHLWAGVKDFADKYFSLNGKHYMFITDVTFGQVCAYNRRVMDEFGFDDPAQLYYNDEWTWDVFYNMCLEFTSPDEDRYALDGWGYSSGLMRSCGTMIVNYDVDASKFVNNIDDPRIERAATLLYDIAKNGCVYPRWNNGWNLRNNTEGAGMKEGLLLFYIRGTWVFTGTVDEISNIWGDLTEGELMFVPVPRDPNGDGLYYTETTPTGYCLVKGAENPEGAALLASCDRFKVLDPTVVSFDRRQLEETYLWTEEMLSMYDECYRLANTDNTMVAFDAGYGDKIYNIVGECEGIAGQKEPSTWAQVKEKYSESLEYYIGELNKQVEEFN